MIRKAILSALVLATIAGSALATAGGAQAQQYGDPGWQGQGGNWGHRPPPPPPPGPPPAPQRRHHHGNGGAIAGGLAAGVIGGLIGGAIANGNGGPVYAEPPPPPPPRCWFEQRSVQNQYDDGWHYENVRVCR